MAIIDEEGRLFGTINVVDALVVLLVLAVGLAGVALVVSGGGGGPVGPTETRYVTLDLATQPEFLIEQIEVGDTGSLGAGAQDATITDSYITTGGAGTNAVIRVAVNQTGDGPFTIGGEPLRVGRQLNFVNESYAIDNATIREVGNESSLLTPERIVVLRGAVPNSVAAEVSAGNEITVAGNRVATIQGVATYSAENPDRKTLFLNATLRTYSTGDAVRFGGTRVETGQTLTLPLAGYQFNGTVGRVGGGLDRTTEEVLVTDVVDVDVAQQIESEDTYDVAGRTVATVENVAVYGTNDPDRKRVYVGLSVEALGYGELPLFGPGNPLRDGATLPFRTPGYEFAGEIVRLDGFQQPGEPTTRTVTLEMANVSPERAASVTAGLTETNAGQTVARITNVNVTPAVITLTSESGEIFEREHPVNKDVTLTVELHVRERVSGVRFKGRTLQEGNRITLDLGVTTIAATVVELDASDE